MARAYVPLAEVVEAFFDNGSEPPGYVWKALADHADSNWERWRRGGYEVFEGDNGDTTFPDGMVVNSDAYALKPSHVAVMIRSEIVEWWEEQEPRAPYDDLDVSTIFVHVGKFKDWCRSVDIDCPNLTGSKGKAPVSKGKHRGPQRLGLPPAVDVQSDEDELAASNPASGSQAWLDGLVRALMSMSWRPTKKRLVEWVQRIDGKVSERSILKAWAKWAPEDAKQGGRPPSKTAAT